MRVLGTFFALMLTTARLSVAEEAGSGGRTVLSETEKARLRGKLPPYDPSASASPRLPAPPTETGEAARRVPAAKGTSHSAPPSGPPAAEAQPPAGEKTISLSPYIVRAKPVASGSALPRATAARPQTEDKIDPFASPLARREAITKKYLSSFDRNFLNRWTLPVFGVSQFQRANALYENDVRAAELNKMADILDVPGENDSEKEKKEMRLLYEQLLYQGRH